jgi:hypothetical protein
MDLIAINNLMKQYNLAVLPLQKTICLLHFLMIYLESYEKNTQLENTYHCII